MSCDHQDTLPPTTTTTTGQLHRQPSPSTDGNNLLTFTNLLPHTPSPMDSNSTPGSRLAAAIGRVIFNNIPPISVQYSTPPTNTLLRTLSDADSTANQTTTTTTTPPKVPRNSPLRQDTITVDHQQTQKTGKIMTTPLRRSLSDTSDYEQPRKTPRVSSSSQRFKRIEDMVREIEHRCKEIMKEEEVVEVEEEDECVGVERLKNGDLKFELGCSCGKSFEILIKHNGYCFYRLT